MLLADKKVAIIGGGPGGLTLARLLQLKGVDVTVYERDANADARVQGATLDLHFESGLKAIKAMGLRDAFVANYRPGAEKGRIIDKYGKIVYDEHTTDLAPTTDRLDLDSEYARPEIDRGPLRDILLDSLKPGTVVWDSQFKNMVPAGDGWQIEFMNGRTVTVDIVIGADGGNSRVRPFVTDIKPAYAGVVIVQGNVGNAATIVPEASELLKGGKVYVHADGKYLHISSKGDGSIDFYLVDEKPEGWWDNSGVDFSDGKQVLAWFLSETPGWNEVWAPMFEKADSPYLLRPQYCIPFDQSWEAHTNVTLLGDAAHIMPPSGEGVNLAMLDALELSESLTSGEFTDLKTAISSYEAAMQERGTAEAQSSIEMSQWMRTEDAQERLLQLFNHLD
ncbi:2-polyprenyl-6-methoxyphenol hydroxylase [Dyadobacter sp. SG02]|uniref:FAD-dependent oxidoreductase n=1 Tax=Dyadobacter sp. SG02 TaxID=1855291 RepID=UPI0008D02483|nr:NAD(P)/FAD-dependent oxidoreductase [Dyadobacter sp. SG02]SEJ36346.1 2-polyprenyl-6-methoxyphenol hydroxylase [Dyadobacter sp. SG02]